MHSDRQVNLIKRSIQRFGFNNPILVDSANNIIAGHGRARAAQQLGMNTVPVLRVEHLNPVEIRAYIIADNRLAEKSGWDRALLAIELQGLSEIGFEIDAIGFEPAELDIVLEEADEVSGKSELYDVIPATEKVLVSKPGCLWICGNHRVFCGDARDERHYERVLDGDKASFVFTDPPYNVKIAGHVSSRGHDEFAMASGEMRPEEFSTFLEIVFRLMSAYYG